MSLISFSNMTFAYEGSYDNIFENVSFQIDTGWKLGLTGRHGRGKTTFLSLLLGRYEYTGTITFNTAFEYFPYEVKNTSDNVVDIIGFICPGYIHWRLMKELTQLEIPEEVLYRPFSTLSNGEQTKVLLAALFLKESSFLLIDEPTNHLDARGREIVSKYLNTKSGFILVSHDRAFLDNCIDHILSINKTNIEIQKGNFSSWLINKERQDAFELSENEKLKKDIGRLKKAARQSSDWADKVESTKIGKKGMSIEKSVDSRAYIGEKSRRMQQRRKNLERRQQSSIEEKSKLLKNIERSESLKMPRLEYHRDRLVALDSVSVFYGEKVACKDVSFTIEQGDRVALCGKNGSGKSSLLKLICCLDIDFKGSFYKAGQIKISYVPQDTSFLKGNLSVFAKEWNIDESLFKAILRKLDFSRVQFEKDMDDFSGGQKKKVLLAKSLCENAHLYVWDEPLNFVDVISRIQIEELLTAFKPTILFVEHDKVFTDKIATKQIFI